MRSIKIASLPSKHVVVAVSGDIEHPRGMINLSHKPSFK